MCIRPTSSQDLDKAFRFGISMPNVEKKIQYDDFVNQRNRLEERIKETHLTGSKVIVIIILFIATYGVVILMPCIVLLVTKGLNIFSILGIGIGVAMFIKIPLISKQERKEYTEQLEVVNKQIEALSTEFSRVECQKELATLDNALHEEKIRDEERLEKARAERMRVEQEIRRERCVEEFNGDWQAFQRVEAAEKAEAEARAAAYFRESLAQAEMERHNREMEQLEKERLRTIQDEQEKAERRRASARQRYIDASAVAATGVGRGTLSGNKEIAEMEKARALADLL